MILSVGADEAVLAASRRGASRYFYEGKGVGQEEYGLHDDGVHGDANWRG
jgi:hypothetical protein